MRTRRGVFIRSSIDLKLAASRFVQEQIDEYGGAEMRRRIKRRDREFGSRSLNHYTSEIPF